mmetsp:Transcript_3337/g.13505  ORF Transcript_3337/g.13505 Transcript_3337/m.13505 type:complete len:297 (-) Transcript_3337:910-1800(-)
MSPWRISSKMALVGPSLASLKRVLVRAVHGGKVRLASMPKSTSMPSISPSESGPADGNTSRGRMFSSSMSLSMMGCGIPASHSRRTNGANLRSRISSVIISSRSSASSSCRSTSALRVTRKACVESMAMPPKRQSRLAAMICSSEMKACPSREVMRTQRLSWLGTLMIASFEESSIGSRSTTASEIVRLEMYGKGWPGSMASGVSMGSSWSRKIVRRPAFSASVSSGYASRLTPWSRRPGMISRMSTATCACTISWVASAMYSSCWSGVKKFVVRSRRRWSMPAASCRLRPPTRFM